MGRIESYVSSCAFLLIASSMALADSKTFRLYDGIAAYVNNASGREFIVDLEVRDINLFADGPRELLVKTYAPDGKVLVREIIPDDGVASHAYLPAIGGWDHELWYYTFCRSRGEQPEIAFSALSDPSRLATIAARKFSYKIPASGAGIYRVVITGVNDHFITLTLSPNLPYAICGHPMWLHGHGDMFAKSFIYIPRGTSAIHLGLIEPDEPQTRRFTLTDSRGVKLFEGGAIGAFVERNIELDPTANYDDTLLTLTVSPGAGDYMLHLTLINQFARGDEHDEYFAKMPRGPAAILAPDEATARAVRGGTIEHDGEIFWHPFQVRFHDFVKTLPKSDLKVIRLPGSHDGWDIVGLPSRDGYIKPVGRVITPPLCDRIMYSYALHHNPAALHLALREIESSLRSISTGDYMSVPGFNGNAGYISCYGWPYWRAAMRMMQEPDVPTEVRDILREAFILAGDRIAFARSQERVNGNAFSKIPIALKYCSEGTGDAMQKQLFEHYWNAFVSEGFGPRTGISSSGDCQEHFGHDALYGVLILEDLRAPIADFGDERFKQVQQRVANFYSYTWCEYAWDANPWGARTAWRIEPSDVKPYFDHWKGEPGPDFTTSVNGGNEFFAARRANYYAVTFHGRLCPLWLANHFADNTRIGYGGGMICHLSVPGHGAVIASTLNGDYGEKMEPHNWRNFHLHTLVGTLADGRAVVSGDSEQLDAHLDGTTVTGDSEIRGLPLHIWRRFDFADDTISCEARLGESSYTPQRQWPERKQILTEAFEMIPFVKPAKITPDVAEKPQLTQTITIDRGGYGVRIELDKPREVCLGENNTLLIRLIDQPTPAGQIGIQYRLVPYVAK